jgi:glucosamine kinase
MGRTGDSHICEFGSSCAGLRRAGDAFAEEIVAEGARQADVLIRSPVEFGAPRISFWGSSFAHGSVAFTQVAHFLTPPEVTQ